MRKDFFEEHITHGSATFPVGIYNMNFNKESDVLFPVHYHKEFEFLLINKGNVKIQLEGKTLYLKSGDGIFINSGTLHSAVSICEKECSFTAVVFLPEFIAAYYENSYERYIHAVIRNELTIPLELSNDVIDLIIETSDLFESADFGYELFIKSNIIKMMAICIAKSEHHVEKKHDDKTDIVKIVIDYIHQNYNNNLTLGSLSSYAHISREHLCRIFREVADSSPIVYLNRYRIIQSAYMLRNTNKTVSEISSECGFNNSSYFNKLFMRFMNCTPLEYRNNL